MTATERLPMQRILTDTLNKQRGFTIIEVAIVAPMLILIVLGILALLINLVTDNAVQIARNSLIGETRSAFSAIENDVASSSTFIPSSLPSNFTDGSPRPTSFTYKSDGTTTNNVSSSNLKGIFLQGYNQVLDPDPSNTSKTRTIPAYKQNGDPTCSNINTDLGNAMPIAVMYWVEKGDLYRRTIIDKDTPTTAICGTPLVKQSCPEDAAQVAPCTVIDTKLMSNVTKFQIDYYLTPSSTTPMNAYIASPSPTIDQARSIQVTVEATKQAAGQSVNYSSSLRISRLST